MSNSSSQEKTEVIAVPYEPPSKNSFPLFGNFFFFLDYCINFGN